MPGFVVTADGPQKRARVKVPKFHSPLDDAGIQISYDGEHIVISGFHTGDFDLLGEHKIPLTEFLEELGIMEVAFQSVRDVIEELEKKISAIMTQIEGDQH